jgi:hypothetical protein
MINETIILFLIDNLIIKDIIKLFITNKKYYNFMKNNYKILCNIYYPKYNIKSIYDFNECNKIYYQNLFFINKQKLIKNIIQNDWSYHFFKYKYININNKEDTYIHNLILNIIKNIYLVNQLDIKEKNEKYIGISYYNIKLDLLNETEIYKKDLDIYLKYNIKKKINHIYNLNEMIQFMI